jgi:hypothetical protein
VSIRCRPVSVALLGLLLWTTACTSYKQIELPEVADHAKVRVTLTDGERFVVYEPALAADSIHYWEREADRPQRVHTIPLDQVSVLEARQGDVLKTLGLTVGVMALIVGASLLACSDGGCTPSHY